MTTITNFVWDIFKLPFVLGFEAVTVILKKLTGKIPPPLSESDSDDGEIHLSNRSASESQTDSDTEEQISPQEELPEQSSADSHTAKHETIVAGVASPPVAPRVPSSSEWAGVIIAVAMIGAIMRFNTRDDS